MAWMPTTTTTTPLPTGSSTSTSAPTSSSTSTAVPTSTTPIPTGTTTSDPIPTATDTSIVVDPPPNTNEFTLTSAAFDVPAGAEVYKCQNFRNPIGADVAVVETSSFMAAGSHHMFVFHGSTFNADSNAISDCSGNEFHDYIHVAQVPQETITYPAGVGRSLPGGDGLRILAHYLNTGTTTLHAQIALTFKYVQPNEVTYLAAQMFLNQGRLLVPPGVSTQSSTFTIPYDIEMLYAVSHMHKHGTHFVATTSAGQTVYDGMDWDEPVEAAYSPPMHIAGGSTLTWACTFNNDTGGYLTFGDSAITNEMCIVNAVFYPSQAGQNQGKALDTNF